MAQKAYIIEGISGDILEHEPIASQIAEGFQVSSINAFNKDGKPMCLVLLSDGESSGGGSDSDYLAPPVFSPMAHLAYPYESQEGTLEVTLTAEEGTTILYALKAGYTPSSNEFSVYEEPIELTEGGGDIFAFATKGTGQEIEVSPVVVARYILGGK